MRMVSSTGSVRQKDKVRKMPIPVPVSTLLLNEETISFTIIMPQAK